MHKELPLYIFIRNTIILCVLFFIISAFLIGKTHKNEGKKDFLKEIFSAKNNIQDDKPSILLSQK